MNINVAKIYGLLGKALCGVAGAIVGFFAGGVYVAVVGAVVGVVAGHFLEKTVMGPLLGK
jgi:hypothetical protein